MTHTKDNIALMEVPEGAKGFRTEMNGRWLSFYVMTGEKKAFPEQRDLLLPPGSWRFVCLSTEMTEEKARMIVEPIYSLHGKAVVGYKDYLDARAILKSALHSYFTLLTARACDPAATYAVCVKKL